MNVADQKNVAEIRDQLQALSGSLRHVDHLSQDARQRLAELIDELSAALAAESTASASGAAGLSASVAQLARAIQEDHEAGLLEAARRRLEKSIVSVETEAPVLSGIALRLIRALSDLGI